jgi:hypothetical protein
VLSVRDGTSYSITVKEGVGRLCVAQQLEKRDQRVIRDHEERTDPTSPINQFYKAWAGGLIESAKERINNVTSGDKSK